ncbi:MAG: TonB-dependent receptor [Bacteroidota bacterium]|nr:TonB-dependent receptor [Bacteroidota bacterium]
MKKILLLFLVFVSFISAFSQNDISGKIIDYTTKEPILGASVMIQGTNVGTVTDLDGKFKLKSVSVKTKLLVSYIGYNKTVFPLSGKTDVIIELKENNVELDQVVVIGYGVQKKSDLTGAVSSIKSEEIRNLPTSNVIQALQGKAAGVEIVQNSGSPGAATSIRIRGAGTINNSDPLYIVDGMAMDNISYLAPDDIASIEILKDAASSAIYGSRAANGVVLLTTRSGSESLRPKITFNSYLGWQEAWRKPNIMSKDEFVYYQDYALDLYKNTQRSSNGSLSIREDQQLKIANGSNWWNEISRRGFMQKNSLSVSGGSKQINYYASTNFMGTNGIIDRSSYDRFTILGKINANLSKTFSMGLNMSYSHEFRSVVEEDGQYGVVKQSLIGSPLDPTINSYGEYIWNTPVEKIRRATYGDTNETLLAQLNLNWIIIPSLIFNSRASINSSNNHNNIYQRFNQSETVLGDNSHYIRRDISRTNNISWDNILTYYKVFNKVHDLSVMAGQTLELSDYESFGVSGSGVGGYDDGYNAVDFAQISKDSWGSGTGWRALGFLGRLSYDYKSKYLIQTNFRLDGSSRFLNNRWGFFPSVSTGWKLTGEDFLKDVEWLSMLKLRVGWGQLGNNRVGNFAYGTFVQSDGFYNYGVTNPTLKEAMSVKQIGNPNIKWERTESVNFAIDFNALNNRFFSTFDFFNKDTKNMLIAVPLPLYNGFNPNGVPMQNAGSVNNIGVEFQLGWRDKIEKVKYEFSGNITHVENKVTSLGASNDPIYGGNVAELGFINKSMVNAPIGSFFGWKTAGIIQEGEDISKLATFKTEYHFGPGDMKFVDTNKDGVIDDADKTFLGSPFPALYYGFNANFSYAGFDLSMFFQGVYGNKIYNATRYYTYGNVVNGQAGYNVINNYFDDLWRGTPSNPSVDFRSNWSANPGGIIPAPNTNSAIRNFNFRNSDMYIEDGSYLRLKTLQLGYSIDSKLCSKIGITSLKIYAAINNLLTFTNYSGLDPEIGKSLGQEANNLYLGIDEGSYPQARSYTFGLVLDF